jgi:uncharacterized protein
MVFAVSDKQRSPFLQDCQQPLAYNQVNSPCKPYMKPDPKVVETVTKRVVEAVNPLRIILFGSAARGEMKPDSDLDILVVMTEGIHRRKTTQAIYQQLIGLTTPVDVVVATEKDLRLHGDNFSLVYYFALRDGKEIYAA